VAADGPHPVDEIVPAGGKGHHRPALLPCSGAEEVDLDAEVAELSIAFAPCADDAAVADPNDAH
jgi:hypothetical protein